MYVGQNEKFFCVISSVCAAVAQVEHLSLRESFLWTQRNESVFSVCTWTAGEW